LDVFLRVNVAEIQQTTNGVCDILYFLSTNSKRKMKKWIQIIGRFEAPEEMIFYVGSKIESKGGREFEVTSTDNGTVYVESGNERAIAIAYKITCRIEKLQQPRRI